MRLIHTSTLTLHEFTGSQIPLYAILSHTWEGHEITYEEMLEDRGTLTPAWRKITGCCAQAARDGWQYVWIDTCCISKTSPAELSESINAMATYYTNSQTCYVYLSDVPSPVSPSDKNSFFRTSKWFSRSWTLPELLFPRHVEFYTSDWIEIGTKASLRPLVEEITGIKDLEKWREECIAVKMSWAAGRKAEREDRAYALMGIFGVSMGVLYGEGERNAFRRLQEEILKRTDDESLFAWEGVAEGGLLAGSVDAFKGCGDIRLVRGGRSREWEMTNRGLRIELMVEGWGYDDQDEDEKREVFVAPLQCTRFTDPKVFLALKIERTRGYRDSDEEWEAKREDRLISYRARKSRNSATETRIIYFKQPSHTPSQTNSPSKIIIPMQHIFDTGFFPAQRQTGEKQIPWLPNEFAGYISRPALKENEVSALYFTNEDFGIFLLVARMLDQKLCVEIMLPVHHVQRLDQAVFTDIVDRKGGSDRAKVRMPNVMVVDAKVKIGVERGEGVYKIEIEVGWENGIEKRRASLEERRRPLIEVEEGRQKSYTL